MKRIPFLIVLLLASCASPGHRRGIAGAPPGHRRSDAPDPAGHVECDVDNCRFVPDAPKVAPTNEGVTKSPFALPDHEPARRERDPVVPRAPTHSVAPVVVGAPVIVAREPGREDVKPGEYETAPAPIQGHQSTRCPIAHAPWYCSADFTFCVLLAVIALAVIGLVIFNKRRS